MEQKDNKLDILLRIKQTLEALQHDKALDPLKRSDRLARTHHGERIDTGRKRLAVTILVMAGAIVLNVYVVLTGAADDFYSRMLGRAPDSGTGAADEAHISAEC